MGGGGGGGEGKKKKGKKRKMFIQSVNQSVSHINNITVITEFQN